MCFHLIFALWSANNGQMSLAHRCYVCLSKGLSPDEAESLFPGPPKLQYCDQFRPRDPDFIRECPQGYTGCLTQMQGNNIMRMCADLPMEINDCKLVNNIQYCYCYGEELCNFATATSTTPRHLEDDEDDDFLEGSGEGNEGHHRNLHTTRAPTPFGTTSSSKNTDNISQSNNLVLPTFRTLLSLLMLVALITL